VAGLFLDKLSNMVGENIGLDPKFMEHVSKKFAEDFQEEYIEDKNADENNKFIISSTFEHNMLDDAPLRTILKGFLSPWSWLLI